MTKNRPLVKNALYNWCEWLINHIPEPTKRFASSGKEKTICPFQISNKDYYKPKKDNGEFDDR